MVITPFYAGLLGLFFIFLSINVIRTRRTTGVSLGDGDDRLLARRIRAQGNFAEYAPMALLLIFFAEQQGAAAVYVHVLNLLLLIGRGLHGAALSSLTLRPACRTTGMVLTFAVIVMASLTVAIYPLFSG